jgi:hypothetical protein
MTSTIGDQGLRKLQRHGIIDRKLQITLAFEKFLSIKHLFQIFEK